MKLTLDEENRIENKSKVKKIVVYCCCCCTVVVMLWQQDTEPNDTQHDLSIQAFNIKTLSIMTFSIRHPA
jgi:hypothetical protein